MDKVRIGVIGGSGVYQMEALTDIEKVRVSTPLATPRMLSPSAPWLASGWPFCLATEWATASCPPRSTRGPTSTP